jgi:hypothetical protein
MTMAFSVVSCVSNRELFQEALGASAEMARREPVEFVAIDNAENQYSAPQALNRGAALANGEVLVFLHQDVHLPAGWFERLSDQIRIVERTSRDWGVLGVFGVSQDGRMVGHIDDPHGLRRWGCLPCRVQSLDEVCLVIRSESGLRFDDELGGFHLYGADLCLQAQKRGMDCYALDVPLKHLSGGKVDDRFWKMARRFETKWRNMAGSPAAVETTCGIFQTRDGIFATCVAVSWKLRRKLRRRLCRRTMAGSAWGSR